MTDWKPIARLGLGWLMMLGGAAVLLDCGIPPSRPRNQTWPAIEALVGFAFVSAGWFLRRTAKKLNGPR